MKYLRLILAMSLTPAIAPAAFAESTLDMIRSRGALRVGTTGDYRPFTFRNPDGTYTGADIVMARHLASKLGVGLEFVPTRWTDLLPDFIAKKFDVAMGGVSVTPARAEKGDFSTVVVSDGKRPIVRCADRDRFTSIQNIDQPGVRVIVNPGASNETFARANFHRAQLIIHADNTTIFDEIAAGRADVMVTDGIEVKQQVYIRPELCVANVDAPFTKVDKAYLLPRDPEFVAFVNDWLASEKSSGAWQRTLDEALHHFASSLGPNPDQAPNTMSGLIIFTLAHVVVSLMAIGSGFVVLFGLMAGKRLDGWTAFLLATTVATSVTGFGFPIHGFTPGLGLGVISLLVLAVAIYARCARHLTGIWRRVYVVAATAALYFNFLVLSVQAFQKVPALKALAPTRTELPFVLAQLIAPVVFIVLGIQAAIRFREQPSSMA